MGKLVREVRREICTFFKPISVLVIICCMGINSISCLGSNPVEVKEKQEDADVKRNGTLIKDIDIPSELLEVSDISQEEKAYTRIIEFTAIQLERPLVKKIKKRIETENSVDPSKPNYARYCQQLKEGAWEDWRTLQGLLQTYKKREQKFVNICSTVHAIKKESEKILAEKQVKIQQLEEQLREKETEIKRCKNQIQFHKARQSYWSMLYDWWYSSKPEEEKTLPENV
jgi:chromosome segregation ATPase